MAPRRRCRRSSSSPSRRRRTSGRSRSARASSCSRRCSGGIAGAASASQRRTRPMSDEVAATSEPVLIVDDEKNIRRTLRMVLEGEGHVVHEAGSIAEAENVLARDAVDLILLDVKLGDNDNGLDLLRTLKARGEDGMSSRTSEIPVVMISGHATIEDAVQATRLGA